MLNEYQKKILQAIGEDILSDSEVSERASLDIDTVRYYLEELAGKKYIKVYNSRTFDGEDSYEGCHLLSKGKVAVANPDKLIKT